MSRLFERRADDAVGNLTGHLIEAGVAQTLNWSHENRLAKVKNSIQEHG